MTKHGQGRGAAASSKRGASPNLVGGEPRLQKNCSLTKMEANHKIMVYLNRERCD